MRPIFFIILCVALRLATSIADAQPRLTGSFLPQSRNVEVPASATFFATLINYGDAEATNCRPTLYGWVDAPEGNSSFHYFSLDASNSITSGENTPVTLNAGESRQFLIELRHRLNSSGEPIPFEALGWLGFLCNETGYVGIEHNGSLRARSYSVPVADVIAIGSTLSGDQIMRAPAPDRRAVMAVAAINIGAPQRLAIRPWATLYPNLDLDVDERLDLSVCETDSEARCLSDPVREFPFDLGTNEIRTFNVYARSLDLSGIPLQPAYNRVHVAILPVNPVTDQIGSTNRTSTSAAIHVPRAQDAPVAGVWTYLAVPTVNLEAPVPVVPHEGEFYVVPRPEEWASDGLIVVQQGNHGLERELNQERFPTVPIRIDWRYVPSLERVIPFTPHVEIGGSYVGYRYYFPVGSSPLGNLNFRTENRGGGLVSSRWRQLWSHQNCSGACRGTDERLDWDYEIAGLRPVQRNNFNFADLPLDLTISVWRPTGPTDMRLQIDEAGRLEGVGVFERNNFPSSLVCPYSGQVYDTVPGSPVFYVRLTVPESANCETDGFPPISPYIEDDYEGILVLMPFRDGIRNYLRYRLYIWTMDWPIPTWDRSYHTYVDYIVPVPDED